MVIASAVGLLLAFTLAPLPVLARAGQTADPIAGFWYTQDRDGIIEFYPCGDSVCGRIRWIKNNEVDGDVSRDTDNPDPAKRGRPLCGLTFITGFTPDGKGGYTGGLIYSPHHGADFHAEMTLVDHDTLNLRGYILTPLLGETQTWKRAAGDVPQCHVPDR